MLILIKFLLILIFLSLFKVFTFSALVILYFSIFTLFIQLIYKLPGKQTS